MLLKIIDFVMYFSSIKRFLEPIGLVLLLLAFGWQCWEEQAYQLKVYGLFYEEDQKLEAVWMGIYDEALQSERYHGKASVLVDYDVINRTLRDWGQIRKDFTTLDKQTSFFLWARVVFYVLGSILVVVGKWPENRSSFLRMRD